MSPTGPFAQFRRLLPDFYPALWDEARVTEHADSLLLHLPGNGSGAPVGFVGHYDVVPPGQGPWRRGPFDGEIDGGEVWGRGAMDDKGRLVALLEALEACLVDGARPAREVYVLIDHDEETTGAGAVALEGELAARGVRFAALFDEGEGILHGALPGLAAPTAMIGVAEKGFANVILTARDSPGHSSMPSAVPAPLRLARAVVRTEKATRPLRITAPVRELVAAVIPHAGRRWRALYRVALIAPRAGARLLAATVPELRPALGTTVAVTRLSAGDADNSLAATARATVNVRLLPGDSIEAIRSLIVTAVADSAVDVEIEQPCEASTAAPTTGPIWEALTCALAASHPETIPVPGLLTGATDSRHLATRTEAVYRFMPLAITSEQRGGLHGPDERVTITEWERTIAFYRELITRL